MEYRMVAEVEKWVARLNAHVHGASRSRPAASAQYWLLGKIGSWATGPGLEAAYRRHLLTLTRARRANADTATRRKRLELQIGQLERQADQQGNPDSKNSDGDAADQSHTARDVTGQLADLRRQYAEMQAKEERITAANRRLMTEINAFRTGEEATKAAYTAAEEAAEAVWAEMNRNPGDRC
jgi:chromosome segregation ATPase